MIKVAHIWRHPIKSHGREALQDVTLTKGQTMPWDRTWAVAHEGARIDGTEWAPCANFSRGAKAPALMGISTRFDEGRELVTLSHPELDEITLHPERDQERLIDWARPLMPENRAASARVIRLDNRGVTDTPFPSISIANLKSNRVIEEMLGQPLDPVRWRANLWLDGLEIWQEAEWVGKTLSIGEAELRVEEQITRCLATTVNPATGQRDADTLGALKKLGHQEFGIYAVVTRTGKVALGDQVTVH